VVIVIYGWQGGSTDTASAARTSEILLAAEEEFTHIPAVPKLIVGDLNADSVDLTAYGELTHRGWVDLGAHHHPEGASAHTPTCLAASSVQATRRDYILADTLAMHHITNFQVIANSSLPVHSPIDVTFKFQETSFPVNIPWKPGAFASLKQFLPLPPPPPPTAPDEPITPDPSPELFLAQRKRTLPNIYSTAHTAL
jgi:hypothetical protein